MNRRGFFSIIASALGTFTLWPRSASALPQSIEEITREAQGYEANAIRERLRKRPNKFYPAPVHYDGDLLDPRYHLAGMKPHALTRTGKLFVNGVDRTTEAYEAYEGEDGWANLFLWAFDPVFMHRKIVRVDHQVATCVRYSIRGRVEWQEIVPDYHAEAVKVLNELASGRGINLP